jgi:hypothetical protein
MNIFLSWSGERSRAIAEALRDWLPNVIQSLKPWMSQEDIAKGAKWDAEIAQYLKTCPLGIICLTPESLTAPWLLFEAGALSNNVEIKDISGQNVIVGKTTVCTYLYELTPNQVKEPLAKFQATVAIKHDTKRLLQTINNKLGQSGLSEKQLNTAFEKCWPDLKEAFDHIPKQQGVIKPKRSPEDMLDEILTLVRNLNKQQESAELSKRLRNLILHSANTSTGLSLLAQAQTEDDARRQIKIDDMVEALKGPKKGLETPPNELPS